MQDEFVICMNCGREIPNTLYCIYCGVALPEKVKKPKTAPVEKTSEEKVESVEPKSIPKIAGDIFSKTPLDDFKIWVETSSVTNIELDQETLRLMGDLRKYYIWKVKLCGLLADDGVSEEVFTKIFEEYVKEIDQLSEAWNEKIRDYERSMSLAQDIVNCRLKKIVSLSSSSLQMDQILRNLSREERSLYNDLFEMIGGWKSNILKEVEKNE